MISRKSTVTFRHHLHDHEIVQVVKGRIAQTLYSLVTRGDSGITALEMSSWALRLGAYIHILRRQYHMDITTIRVPHDGGSHARYVLNSPVSILLVE